MCYRQFNTKKDVKFAEESMHAVVPVSSNFLDMGNHRCVDIFSIFRFDSIQCLSLGFGSLLKYCIVLTLGDGNRTTSSIRRANGAK